MQRLKKPKLAKLYCTINIRGSFNN